MNLEVEATSDSAAAASTTTEQMEAEENKFCRLCLEERDLIANLFEGRLESSGNIALSEKLFELFQIKYEETPSLPNRICKECLQTIESFTIFRENVHKIESELQKRVASLKYGGGIGAGMLKVIEEIPRAGLNGHPGTFVPEENAIVVEVNPDEEYESSDDDFSMDSDSEAEGEPALHDTSTETAPPSSVPTDSNVSTAQCTIAADVETSNVADPVVMSKVKETTVLTSSNIIEKSYAMEGTPTKVTYACQYCDIAFSEKQECADHVTHHDPTVPYLCSFCATRFTNRQHLITHIRQLHDADRPFVCALCNKGFVRRSDLRKHSIVHTGLRPFTCNVCTKSFSRNTNLTKHMRIHSSTRPHTCVRCSRSFPTGAELVRHTRTHIISKPFHCSKCSLSFARRDKLRQHEQTHLKRDTGYFKGSAANISTHPNAVQPPTTDINQEHQHHQESKPAPVSTFTATTDQNASLNATAPTVNPEEPFRTSLLATQLQQPRMQLPQKPLPPPSIAAPQKPSHYSRHYACEICSQTFTRERDYQRHQALHLDTLFSCKQCGIGFSRREKLARHELEQHAPQYPCKICRIPFTKLSDFEMHMKMHELQQSVTITAQAASLLSAGASLTGFGMNPQSQQHHHQQPQQQQQHQPKPMLPPPSKEYLGMHQRPSVADMNFYSQMVPTMNLGFYSETRPEDRNGI